jgi:hypothetical protein
MAAEKFLQNSGGQIIEVAGATTAAANRIVSTGADGLLSLTLMPVGVAADVETMIASETLTAGHLVNIWNDSGTRKMRKADCSNGRRAHGFVLAGVTSGESGVCYKDSTITSVTLGLADMGSPVYLSTGGTFSTTAPSTAGYISQEIGYCVLGSGTASSGSIAFEPQQPITLA